MRGMRKGAEGCGSAEGAEGCGGAKRGGPKAASPVSAKVSARGRMPLPAR